jgi:predicted RNase H-like nuclease
VFGKVYLKNGLIMSVTIIGIDYATDPNKVGLALGSWHNHKADILAIAKGSRVKPITETIASWIRPDQPTLISLDAPLGWPVRLGYTLASHMAGELITTAPNKLFRRATDCTVRKKLGRQPLDVGADRIARTAHSALQIIEGLGQRIGQSIPLAWDKAIEGISVIEVYPAATLLAHEIRASGYKGSDQEARREIVKSLRSLLTLPSDISLMVSNADVLDAVVCVLAAVDFLSGRVVEPEDRELAMKEGWIWFRPT